MRLFHCPDAQVGRSASVTSILTPLGRVGLEAVIGGDTISSEPPSAVYRLASGGWRTCWHQQAFTLELLVCRPALPASLTENPEFLPTDCWAGMWRLEAHSPIGPLLFAAVWEEGYTWQEGGPHSGENLYAKTWNDEQTEVTIGTQDEEKLAYRAAQNDFLPEEWNNYFRPAPHTGDWDWRTIAYWQHKAHEQLLDIGIPTPLPPLEQGQRCQIHFVVAWANYHEQNIATWRAVDRTPFQILQGANGS